MNSFISCISDCICSGYFWGVFRNFLVFTLFLVTPWTDVNVRFSGPVMVLEKMFKDFPNILPCKVLIPYGGPTQPPGTMILTHLIFTVRKLLDIQQYKKWVIPGVLSASTFDYNSIINEVCERSDRNWYPC